jgi:triacylglycerol esterase/lipase EstA (alpha/beta hydrolase family)
LIDQDLIVFAEQKEALKQRLLTIGYGGLFYSDQKFSNWQPYFSTMFSEAVEKRSIESVHLIVLVHGLEGTSEDLSAYKNYIRIALPNENLQFLLSEANQTETWSNFNNMASNLLGEILRYTDRMPRKPNKISMITHSLGGLIVRALCGLEGMKPLLPRLQTLITLNSPHLGLMYNQRTANWGK